MRRLITLISAGRNRIIVIRRELPRTEDAGWTRRPYRTEHRRILLSVSPRSVTGDVAREYIRSTAGCETRLAIPSCQEVFRHRRQGLSRPRAARRREALTGGGDALQRPWREWQANVEPGLSCCRAKLPPLRFGPNRPDETPAVRGRLQLRFVV